MGKRKRRDDRLRRIEQRKRLAGQVDRLRQIEWTVALFATAVAVFLSFACLFHAGALWRDEVNGVNTAASPSFSEMWRLMEFESSPLLWTLLLRSWISIGAGATDTGLRLLGFLGVLTLPAALWFAALRLGGTVPLASLALVMVNPEVIRWGTSLRAWALGGSLAVVTLVLVRDASESPTPRRVLRAALVAILSVQCVFQNAVLLAAIVAGCVTAALAEREGRRVAVPVGIGTAAAVSLLPYLGSVRRTGQWSMLNQGPLTLGVLAGKVWDVLGASGTIVRVCWLAIVAVALVSVARRGDASGKVPMDNARRDVAIYAAVVLVVAVGGLALFYLRLRYPTQPWYYIGLLALVAACAESALASSTPTPAARITRVVMTLIVLAAGLAPAWASLEERQTNVDQVAARLNADVGRGDLVLVNPWYYAIAFDRYYRGEAEVMTIPPLEDRKVHRYDLLRRQMLSADPMGSLLFRLRQVLESGHRVWLVGDIAAPPPGTEPPSFPPPPLPESGWSAMPYLYSWSLQTGVFLRDHVREGHPIPVEIRGGRFESAGLSVFSGWRP